VRVSAPAGWAPADESGPADLTYFGPAEDGWTPRVVLDQYGEDDLTGEPRSEVLVRSLTRALEGVGTGSATLRRQQDSIRRSNPSEVTFDLDLGTQGDYTVHSEVVESGGAWSTVALFTPREQYDDVAAIVLPSVRPGACS